MLKPLKRFFLYVKYYFEPNDAYVRGLAYRSAQKYFDTPVRNRSNLNPRVREYDLRRAEFLRYQRAFNDAYRHQYAKNKLAA
jgi:hypothetical protein